MNDKAVTRQGRQKRTSVTTISARKERQALLQGNDLRGALEELCDTKSESCAQELKKAISDSICGA
jgi:hypothetical protein